MCVWDPMDLATPDLDRISEVFDFEDQADVQLLGELLDTVLGEAPRALDELLDAQRAGRTQEVASIAHRLKGSFGNLGYMHASQLFHRILQSVGRGDEAALQELVESLGQGSNQLLQGVRDFRDQL